MSTRQLRLTSSDQIKKNLDRISGKRVNVVLSDNTSVIGDVFEIKPDALIIRNGLLKKISYPFSKITEIYFDITL